MHGRKLGSDKGLTSAQQLAYLAQEYILLWSKKVDRYYWYAWDGTLQWGILWNESTGINATGTAYGLLETWLIGSVSSASPCLKCQTPLGNASLSLSNGDPAEIIWNPNTSLEKVVDPAFTTYRTLDNGIVNAIAANSVAVSSEPILLVANKKH